MSTRRILSVVIVAYNEEHSIARCLNSLLSQIEEIDEIIVVDNNSTDKTSDVVKAMNIEKCRVITEKRQGVFFARNAGFDAATGDLIMRIDADSIADPIWAKSTRTFFETCSDDVWAARGSMGYYDLPFIPNRKYLAIIDKIFINGLGSRKQGANLVGSNMVITRQAWKIIRSELTEDAKMMEDVDMTLAIAEHGKRIGMIEDMYTTTSGRRIASRPDKFWAYYRLWPRTYFKKGRYVRGCLVVVSMVFGCFSQFFAWAILLFYNPATNTFSVKPSINRYEERSLP